MNDLIWRAAAVRIIADMHGLCRDDVLRESIQVIKELPTIDAIPVEWLRKWPKDLREGAYVRDILHDWQKEQEAK